jgi:CheY-like chemotaxis protein/anti-sigma regulatory factor (Ser/Thr protein kinase)
LSIVVSDVLATVESLLKDKPVKLLAREQGVPEWLAIDAFRLRQIILNLLSNAIKFTEKGEIVVLSSWQNDVLTLSVTDTGPGMSEAVLKRLFGAFQQASAETASTHGGTGLGLTISLNLARLMGGTIVVSSKEGEGTVFTVTVVASLATPEIAEASSAAVRAPVVKEESAAVLSGTVLVAEDMADIRALVVRHLKRLGLSVLEAENGEQAVEMTLSKRPDAVLMDMDMPIIPGAEATRTLRLCGYSKPILALTAHKGEEERRLALAAGCNAVLDKPLTRGSLQVALASALATRSTEMAVHHA